MRRLGLYLVIAAGLALAAPAPAGAAARWFVEFDGAPAADGTTQAALDADHRRFAEQARADGIDYRERFAYRTLFNGVAIAADEDAVADIGALDGVAAVYPVGTVTVQQTTPAFEPSLAFALTMTGADIAQSRLGFTGRGVHVAVLDTGIDFDHPDLGGCFGAGCRVSTGYDFVGDSYEEDEGNLLWQPVLHPDPIPDDCNGHGTHVAGIIGANGAIRGVAPEVTFGAYRIVGCGGTTSTDVMLAALERAYRDGAHVINMSLGDRFAGWPDSPLPRAASRLVDKGVVVVSAMGNQGAEGVFAAASPGVGEKVIAAASVENLKVTVPGFHLSPDARAIHYLPATSPRPVPTDGTLELARTGTITTPDDACTALPPSSLQGNAALVRRGICTFDVKAANVFAAGAAAMVIYNNVDGLDYTVSTGTVPIPAVYLSRADGELINARLDEGPVQLTWAAAVDLAVPDAGRVSSFSGTGPAADLSLKPDIAAPGGVIRSTWPLEKGGSLVASGTSMATPHVAGAAALYLQAHPATRAQDVAPALLNSADPVPSAAGGLDFVVRQGAGLLDIDDAILATTTITPAKLSLGDTPGRGALTIANDAARAVTYSLSNADTPAAVADGLSVRAQASASAVTFEQHGRPVPAVSIRARGRARLDVRIVPDAALPQGALYGGYLVFTPDDGGAPLRVPYAGHRGDYQAAPAMTPTAQAYPWLARETGRELDGQTVSLHPVYARTGAGETFTFAQRTLPLSPPLPLPLPRTGADQPFVLVHLERHAQRLRIELFSARRGKRLGEAFRAEGLARNAFDTPSAPPWTLVTAVPLDGTVRHGHRREAVPDGDYYVKLTVERALAERRTPAETWTSPVFRINRS
jgi:subtilisin family serine protease